MQFDHHFGSKYGNLQTEPPVSESWLKTPQDECASREIEREHIYFWPLTYLFELGNGLNAVPIEKVVEKEGMIPSQVKVARPSNFIESRYEA